MARGFGGLDLIIQHNVLNTFPLLDKSVHCVVTSPPYWGLRDYGMSDQIGLEPSPVEYVNHIRQVFREIHRVLRDDGTVWLNLGDSYAAQRGGTHQPAETLAGGIGGKTEDGEAVNRGRHDGYNPSRNASAFGLKHKDLCGIPWRVAFALQEDGWYLRQDIIWNKPSVMPESVRDRCTKSHEYMFLLTKSDKYYFDNEAIKEPAVSTDTSKRNRDETKLNNTPGRTKMAGLKTNHYTTRNKRSVWTIASKPYKGAHFATFPPKLVEPCVLAGTSEKGCCAACGAPVIRQVKTIGWESSCSCTTAVVPCRVLDPFSGSGTTVMVSQSLGREGIGFELNPEYIALAEERLKLGK